MLTIRDPQAWAQSFQGLHAFNMELRTKPTMQAPPFQKWHTIVDELVWKPMGDIGDTANLVERFRRHVDAVVERVPPDRLLVLDVREGWGPLCDFLGVPVPGTEFPRTNDREALERSLELEGRALLDALRGDRPPPENASRP